jgi:anti-sigma factor ChrR (cupin superfamily)
VLGGTFSDERGDFTAGTYLLNPEGYEHTPFSKEGGIIFVKLRQYPGENRNQIVVDTPNMRWKDSSVAGITFKTLYSEENYPEEMSLQKWDSGASPGNLAYPGGAELLILRSSLQDENGSYGELSWIRYPAGAEHTPYSPGGCELYVKTGGVSLLDSAEAGK